MDNLKCLLTVPADDCNFKAAVKKATDEELRQAEENLDLRLKVGFSVKTKLKKVRKELEWREKANGMD